jgi:hypothetical protein
MNLGSNKRPILFVIPILVIVGIVVTFLIIRGNLKAPTGLFSKAPKVELKTTYKNPFNKDTQYINPFDKYKNPFVTNR